jgi:hypothetical protein
MTYLQWSAYQVDDATHLFYSHAVTGGGLIALPTPDDAVWVQSAAKTELANKDDVYRATSARGLWKSYAHALQMFRVQCGAANAVGVTHKGYRTSATIYNFYYWNGTTWDLKFYVDTGNTEHTFNLTRQEIIDGMDGSGFNYFMVYCRSTISMSMTVYSDFFSVEPKPMNAYAFPTFANTAAYYLGEQYPASFVAQVQGENTVVTNQGTRDVRGYWFYGGEAYVDTGPGGGNYIWRVFIYYRIGFKTYGLISVSSPPVAVAPNFSGKITTSFTHVRIPEPPSLSVFVACYAGLYIDNASAYVHVDTGSALHSYWVYAGNVDRRSGTLGMGFSGTAQFKCLMCPDLPPQYGTVAWDI